jgi:DNA-binding transcriptional ArsR family regulator
MSSNLPIAATKPKLQRPVVLATFFQALGDPTRVRILELLAEGPMTVSELVSALGLAQGRVSSHVSCLRWCGYLRAEVDGRFNRYTLVDDRLDPGRRRNARISLCSDLRRRARLDTLWPVEGMRSNGMCSLVERR